MHVFHRAAIGQWFETWISCTECSTSYDLIIGSHTSEGMMTVSASLPELQDLVEDNSTVFQAQPWLGFPTRSLWDSGLFSLSVQWFCMVVLMKIELYGCGLINLVFAKYMQSAISKCVAYLQSYLTINFRNADQKWRSWSEASVLLCIRSLITNVVQPHPLLCEMVSKFHSLCVHGNMLITVVLIVIVYTAMKQFKIYSTSKLFST